MNASWSLMPRHHVNASMLGELQIFKHFVDFASLLGWAMRDLVVLFLHLLTTSPGSPVRAGLSELRLRQVRYIQTDHDGRRLSQPSTGRRARDAEVRGDGHVACALDEIP